MQNSNIIGVDVINANAIDSYAGNERIPQSIEMSELNTDLKELTAEGKIYTIICIVEKVETKIISERNIILELLVMDKTEASFVLSIIIEVEDTYPLIEEGDGICIRNLKTYLSKGEIRGKCHGSKNIILFDKHNNTKYLSEDCLCSDQDKEKVQSLQIWYLNKASSKTISEMQVGDYGNLICQMLDFYISKANVATLKIWDGTISNVLPPAKINENRTDVPENCIINLYIYGGHCDTVKQLKNNCIIAVYEAHLYKSLLNEADPRLVMFEGNSGIRGIQILEDTDEQVVHLHEFLYCIKSTHGENRSGLPGNDNSIITQENLSRTGGNLKRCPECNLLFIKECVFHGTQWIKHSLPETYARASLPTTYFKLKKTSNKKDIVITKKTIKKRTKFGPLEGVLKEKDSKNCEFSLFVERNDTTMVMHQEDENTCNWMKFIEPASSFNEINCLVYEIEEEIFFISTKEIHPKEELRVHYSPSYAVKYKLKFLEPTDEVPITSTDASENVLTTNIEMTEIKNMVMNAIENLNNPNLKDILRFLTEVQHLNTDPLKPQIQKFLSCSVTCGLLTKDVNNCYSKK